MLTFCLFGVLCLQSLILGDALRRLAKTKVQNKTISTWAVLVMLVASVTETVGLFTLFLKYHHLIFNFVLVMVGYFFGVTLLVTILFYIGI